MDFPTYDSEEDYLNKQWNENVKNTFLIKNLHELRAQNGYQKANLTFLQEKLTATVPITSTVLPKNYSPLEPSVTYPFWLISSRHPIHKQSNESLFMNRNEAEQLGIKDNDVITLQNDLGTVDIEIQLHEEIPTNVLYYMPSNSIVAENTLLPILTNHTFEIKSVYSRDIFHTINDTFVTIKKRTETT